ncbi:accessory gene regulator B family protein [Gorillibacterium sp. sgz5001074]|uniref:accessory gene regulator B family protein n=1 Tax=Gorillibacterium sp. sgz5001074 TaxID=3446695 RepID=UPI003F6768E6
MAFKIASALKRADPDGPVSVGVMHYALRILLNTAFIVAASLLLGSLAGRTEAVLLTLVSLMLLRMSSGGAHIRSEWGCNLFSTAVCAGIPMVPALPSSLLLVLNAATLLIMLLLAPRPDSNTRMPVSWHPRLKLLSAGMAAANLLIGSQVMGLAFLVQSVTIIPWKKEEPA